MGLADLAHYLDRPCMIRLCIHPIRDMRAHVSESELGRLKLELLPNDRPGVVAELVRMSGARDCAESG